MPQILTGCRIACGAAALIAVSHGDAYLAATLITMGAVTDGLDGAVARWLDESTTFGIWFDYLSDYMCYIVASWSLARAIVPGSGVVQEIVLGVPLVTGAIRYARNGARLSAAGPGVPSLPGLGTVFFAFVPVTAVFLSVDPAAHAWQSPVVIALVLVFSALMLAPIHFPKLSRLRGASALVLVLLALEPFWGTRAIAAASLVIGSAYVVLGAAFGRRPRQDVIPADVAHAHRDLIRS